MTARYRYKTYKSDSFYHLYNRGINRQEIFRDNEDYETFLRILRYSLQKRGPCPIKVDLVAFSLMPNHFHFEIKQEEKYGIVKFIRKVISPYGSYFNKKYERIGPLFQGRYRAKIIDSFQSLLHLSRYLHINQVEAGLVARPEDWLWNSYLDYLELKESGLCKKELILGRIGGVSEYRKFVEAQISKQDWHLIKDLVIEEKKGDGPH